MSYDQAPVPASPAQWPEARSFVRLYTGNPEYQARFVMALFGFRQDLLEWTNDRETAEAIGIVIRGFSKRYHEFLVDGYTPDSDVGTGIYYMDSRLKTDMAELGEVQTMPEQEQ